MHPLPRVHQRIAGRFDAQDLLKPGGQGYGIKATDTSNGRTVFLKMLKASQDDPGFDMQLARFRREASISLSSAAAVNPIETFEDGGRHFIVFEWIDGITLDDHLASQGGRLAPERVLEVISPVAEVLDEAHGKGILHRDIKPLNVMIQPDGTPRVLDWGAAADLQAHTIAGPDDLVGTFAWMSPEQLVTPRDIDHLSDLYSLGLLIYLLLTGRLCVSGKSEETVFKQICETDPPAPHTLDASIPIHFSAAVMQLLQKSPGTRLQSAAAFINAVKQPSTPTEACSNCRRPVRGDNQFCPSCGTPTTPVPTTTACLACGSSINGEPACPGCSRVFSAADHAICLTSGPSAGRVLRIPQGEFTVGRNEVSSLDARISRTQFNMICLNGAAQIQDRGSTNGTFVNGRLATQPTLLEPHLPIHIGPITAEYIKKEILP